MNDPFTDIQASLAAHCQAFALDMRLSGVADLAMFKFDAAGEELEFPNQDMIGPAELSLDIDDSLVSASCVIGISTLVDLNNFRLDALIGQMLKRVKTGTLIPLIDAETLVPYGSLKTKGLIRVLRVEPLKVRPLRGIAIQLGSSVAF